jgi:hypothetical protein
MKDKKDAEVIVNSLLQTLYKKHEDYGPMNIAGAPGGPMNGLRVRMYDKLARLNNLVDTGDTPNYESIEDTLIDLANYAIIGLLVQRGQWKGVTNEHAPIVKKVNYGKDSSSPERPTNTISRQARRPSSNRFREVL